MLALAVALTAVLSGAATAGAPSGSDPAAAPSPQYVDGEVLVRYVAGTTRVEQQQLEREVGSTEQKALGAGVHVLEVGSGKVEQAITRLVRSGRVRYAEPNYVLHVDATPNDASFVQLWGLLNTGQTVNGTTGTPGADIDATLAWDLATGSNEVVVGVVDTGIDYAHPDLAANVWTNPGGIGGCAAGTHGYNAINGTCNPADDHSHGSHVAGTIGAVGNNGVGVAGVSWNVKLVGLKFLNSGGSGSTDDAIEAINWAIQLKQSGVNLRVLNNSWGGGGYSQALKDAIDAAGANDILFVAAAGNSARNNDITPHYPSSYGTANEIAVAATTQHDKLPTFSNYGATSVHLGAPGTNVYSTVPGGSYAYFNGTSMATPHVSGVAALALSVCTLTTTALKSVILGNVDPLAALSGKTTTGGRLNAFKTVSNCGTPPPPPPPPDPDFSLSVTPASRTVGPSGSTTYAVTVNRTGGFAELATLSVAGLPANTSGTFSPNPADGSSTLTVTTAAAPTGSYPLTITGTAGALTRTAAATLVVASTSPDFTLTVSPSSRSVRQGRSTTYAATVRPTNGFADLTTLSVSGLPPGATTSFSANPVAPNQRSTIRIFTTSGSPRGTYTVTVTGTSGALVHSVNVTLLVT
jgi:serine protease